MVEEEELIKVLKDLVRVNEEIVRELKLLNENLERLSSLMASREGWLYQR